MYCMNVSAFPFDVVKVEGETITILFEGGTTATLPRPILEAISNYEPPKIVPMEDDEDDGWYGWWAFGV